VAFDDEAEFACCWCPRCEEAVEKGELGPHIKPLTQPGAEYRELQTVEIGDLATMKRWLELEDSRHALLKLPTGTAGDVLPGDQRHVRIEILEPEPQTIEYDLSFEVTYQFRGVKLGTLGFAVGGMIVVRTAGGLATKSAQALALAHEIGHRCGLTYVKHQDGVTGGRTKGIKGLDLPVGLPKTPVYVGHGHTGGHCAYGVWKQHSTEDEREYVFGTEQVPIEFSRAMFPDAEHCLMYGEADESATKVPLLCEWCSPYLRATSLDEVTKKWVDR
jgi:hypothetical protein